MANSVFVSYSHEDIETLERLRVHLKPLLRANQLNMQDDTQIGIGEDWHQRITRMLAEARVAVLLVSADFLASDYIAKVELPQLLKDACKEASEQERPFDIIPVNVKPSVVERMPQLARLRFANPPTRPLLAMTENEREATFVQIATAIVDSLTRPDSASDLLPPPGPGGSNGDAATQAVDDSVSLWEIQHLRKLSSGEPFPYVPQGPFETELNHLLKLQLIERVEGKGIRTAMRDRDERNDLRNHFYITDAGRRYVEDLKAREDTTALAQTAVPPSEGSVNGAPS